VRILNTHDKGSLYEKKAAKYLEARGFKIIEMNYRFKRAEIDIISQEGDYTVFTEVKYRKRGSRQHPLEAVSPSKIRQISFAAMSYMLVKGKDLPQQVRFDVLAFLGDEPRLIRDAFDYME